MRRVAAILLLVFAALWVLLQFNLLPAAVASVVAPIVYGVSSLACPLFFFVLLYAPGLFRDLWGDLTHTWTRFHTRRHDVEDLQRKIAQLGKSHHMVQLGLVYLRQGKSVPAADLFRQALAKEPGLFEAQYRLGLCLYEQQKFAEASEFLEQVNAAKADHDYGMAYLRLAQSQHRAGNRERARTVFEEFLRFYRGHPEGTYCFALLLADCGELPVARETMREVVQSVRLSPRFQRRRNRHWLLKAHWWLWRNR